MRPPGILAAGRKYEGNSIRPDTDRRQFSAGSDCRPKHEREVKRRGVLTDPVSLSGAAKITKKNFSFKQRIDERKS